MTVLLLGAGFLMALLAGVFLSFSDFVMRSLAATQPAGGIEAMQQINRKVFRTLFIRFWVFSQFAPRECAFLGNTS